VQPAMGPALPIPQVRGPPGSGPGDDEGDESAWPSSSRLSPSHAVRGGISILCTPNGTGHEGQAMPSRTS
jgi:hypothetical protein